MFKKMFFAAALVISAAMLAPQGLSAQKGVVKVQGHPHELLTRQWGGRWKAPEAKLTQTPTDSINPADVKCWAGTPSDTLAIDTAYLLVKWTDGKRANTGDSILIWGYRWNSVTPSGYDVHKYTIDMIRAVANYDCRFSALLQNTGGGSFAVGGFGYNFDENARVKVTFDTSGIPQDTILFRYVGKPNCSAGQYALPYNWKQQVQNAIDKSTGDDGDGTGTGIIDHPFNADYSYPAYDYDFWKLTNPGNVDYEWQSGWYYGYWAFFVKNQLNGPFTYPTESGIATRELHNNYVDGFVFDPLTFTQTMSGDYTARDCDCGCPATVTETRKIGNRK